MYDFVTAMQAEGFRMDSQDFMVGPKSLAWHNGRPYIVRTCYELVEGRWEGFATMERLDAEDTLAEWGN